MRETILSCTIRSIKEACVIIIFFWAFWWIFLRHPAGPIILPAEGEIVKIDASTGEIDIRYSANVPDCYPRLLGISKVSSLDMLKGIKKGDHVLYKFKAVPFPLPIKSESPYFPFSKKEIVSIAVATDKTQWGRRAFHCPSEMLKKK